MPKRCSLPSRLPPVEPSKAWVWRPASVLGRGAVLLGDVDDDDAGDEEHRTSREDRPALPLAADHAPVGVGEAGRDDQDQQHLDEVGEAARVLERVGGVDVEEAAAVGPELLDRLLRGDRALAEDLGAAGEGVDDAVVAEVLDHALGDEEERADDRDRQQHVEQDPDQVLPEVAERAPGAGGDAADQRREDGDPDRRGDEVLDREAGHLGEVGEGRFAAVVLPVGVGDEGGGGVEAEVPGAGVEALRVERLDPLGAEDQVEREPGEEREDDEAAGVGLPVLALGLGVDPEDPVGEPLDRPDDRGEEDAFAVEDVGHVDPDRLDQGDEDGAEDRDLQLALDHQRFSPRSSA